MAELSVRRVAGLPLDQSAPHFTTFLQFCEALAGEGLVEKLFEEVTNQLDDNGLLLRTRFLYRGDYCHVYTEMLVKIAGRETSEVCVLVVKVRIIKETEHSYSQKRRRKSLSA
ncbi:MAG: hypothetical protein ACQERO_12915 [Bacteroidota bacterium]